jgi:glycosyltransferase involved in cell wall biosynthesis
MSAGYLNWIKEFSNLPSSVLREIFPLTSILSSVPNGGLTKIVPSKLKEFNPQDIIFIGSLTKSFNFDPIINAASLSAKEGKSWRFIICGDGPESEMLKHRCSGLNNVEFKGWVDQPAIDKISVNCFAFVAPYKRILNFELNIPNKISDYLSRGKPVFTSLFGEVRTLISEGGCGVGYDDQITGSLFNEIENLAQNLSRYEEMCGNAKRLYDESFDGRVVYGKLAKFILNLH